VRKFAKDMQFLRSLREQDRSEETVEAYKADLGIFAGWFEDANGEEMEPERVTALDVRDYKRWMQKDRGYRPATVNRKLYALRAYFGWSLESGFVQMNPASGARIVKEMRNGPRWLDRREQRNLVRELEIAVQVARTDAALVRAVRDRAALLLMLHTGIRVAELSNAKLVDVKINCRSGSITVVGKGGKWRTVPLNLTARKALSVWLGLRRKEDRLFQSQKMGRWTPKAIWERVKLYGYRAGIERISPHSLRHTCAKNLVDAGVSLDQVARILGHESLSTTMIYTQPCEADLQRAVERVAWEE